MMAINDTNNLDVLADALTFFYAQTQTRVTYEYALMAGFNDSSNDAYELAQFARIVPSKINLIEYNPIEETDIQASTEERTDNFIRNLEKRGLIVNLRRSRGKDIDGACGQLALKNETGAVIPS